MAKVTYIEHDGTEHVIDVKPGLPGLSFDDYLGTRGVGVAPARQVEPGSVTESGPDLSSTPSIPGVGGGGMVTTAPPELLGDVAQDYQFSDDPAQAMKADGRPAHRHPLITPLDLLTEQDKKDLLEFLRSLSGAPLNIASPILPR